MQMVQFECPRHWKPSVAYSFGVERIPLSHYWTSGVIRIGLPVWTWKRHFPEQNGLKGLQMIQFECPRHSNPSVSSNSGVAWFPLSNHWTSGVIRIGLPVWRLKCMKISISFTFILGYNSYYPRGPIMGILPTTNETEGFKSKFCLNSLLRIIKV